MTRHAVTLAALSAALAVGTGCYELDQDLTIHDGGSIDYRWALVLHPGIGKILKVPSPEDFRQEVAGHVGTRGRPIILEDPGRTTYGLELSLPDLAAWKAFREGFIRVFETRWGEAPWIYPPVIEDLGGDWVVRVDAPPVQPGAAPTEGLADTRWTLDVHLPGGDARHDADQVAEDGTLTWQTDLAHARLEGVRATAEFPDPAAPPVALLLGALGGAALIGGTALVAVRARRRAG